jgi:hypothetical protein
LRSVIPKRKKAIARHGWTVLPARELQPSEEAESKRHIATLEYFYRNLDCSNAIDTNERGGFSLLVRQMMDAVANVTPCMKSFGDPKRMELSPRPFALCRSGFSKTPPASFVSWKTKPPWKERR